MIEALEGDYRIEAEDVPEDCDYKAAPEAIQKLVIDKVNYELEKKQQALVQFREKHPDRTSVQLETEEKILTNDYELFFGLYSDIVKQREKAKIQVKE